MSECIWRGSDQPRGIRGRHDDECADEACRGCEPCHETHCAVCVRVHVERGACVECAAAARDDLHAIAALCGQLPAEVEHRGVTSEAMMLFGPSVDPEAWGHVAASVRSGRLDPNWIEASHVRGCDDPRCTGCAGETHPLYVLGSWDMVWRDALEHDEPGEVVTVGSATDYLDRQLTYMAAFDDVPFEDFARDLRRCRSHLEAVLHDGEQRDTGAPCMTCHVPLERTWGTDANGDGWRCPRCHQTSTEEQYRFAIQHLHRDEATHLTDRDCELRTGVKAGTIRSWANKDLVGRRVEFGRRVYAVADVLEQARRARLIA